MRLRCAGTTLEVSLRETRDGAQASVDGLVLEVRVGKVAPGVFLVRHGDSVQAFHCVRSGDEIHLSWKGVTYRLLEEGEGARTAQRQHAGGLEAPMPGKVIKVSVAEGDQVSRGQEILVVEAMKMENAIRAPRDGRVGKIAARVGDMVSPGVTLVELSRARSRAARAWWRWARGAGCRTSRWAWAWTTGWPSATRSWRRACPSWRSARSSPRNGCRRWPAPTRWRGAWPGGA